MKRPNNPESQNARNPRRTPGFLATKNLATQFAIGDINDVDFGNFEGGVGVSAGESSKINILSQAFLVMARVLDRRPIFRK
jgi:hypothetical protein